MSVTQEEKREIIKDHSRFLAKKKEDWAAENTRILSEYKRLIAEEGSTHEGVTSVLCERFSCTPRRIENIINRVYGVTDQSMISFNKATIMGAITTLEDQIIRAAEHTNKTLQQYDQLEDDAWVDIEQVKAPNGLTTKRVSVAQAKRQALNDLIQQVQEKIKALRSLVPQTVIQQNFDQRGLLDQMSDADLTRQLNDLGIEEGGHESA